MVLRDARYDRDTSLLSFGMHTYISSGCLWSFFKRFEFQTGPGNLEDNRRYLRYLPQMRNLWLCHQSTYVAFASSSSTCFRGLIYLDPDVLLILPVMKHGRNFYFMKTQNWDWRSICRDWKLFSPFFVKRSLVDWLSTSFLLIGILLDFPGLKELVIKFNIEYCEMAFRRMFKFFESRIGVVGVRDEFGKHMTKWTRKFIWKACSCKTLCDYQKGEREALERGYLRSNLEMDLFCPTHKHERDLFSITLAEGNSDWVVCSISLSALMIWQT